jgi:hypothetical protein
MLNCVSAVVAVPGLDPGMGMTMGVTQLDQNMH